MTPSDAANLLVHRYPGGATSLAPRMGKKPNTLSHEVTRTGLAKLGLDDAVLMSQISGDRVVLNAFAEAMNCMVLPLAATEGCHVALMNSVADLARDFSAVVTAAVDADSDGRITANELAAVEARWAELLGVGQAMLAHLRTRHEDGKPEHVRRSDAAAARTSRQQPSQEAA